MVVVQVMIVLEEIFRAIKSVASSIVNSVFDCTSKCNNYNIIELDSFHSNSSREYSKL